MAMRSSAAGSAERSPVVTAKRRGTRQISPVMKTIGLSPRPSQSTADGAYATIGVTWMSTATGVEACSRNRDRAITAPHSSATASATR